MGLYTFFLEYEGGTYISQVSAESHEAAPRKWIEEFTQPNEKEYLHLFEKDFRESLIASLQLNLITPIDGLTNTWSFSAYALEKPSTIHFTQTVE